MVALHEHEQVHSFVHIKIIFFILRYYHSNTTVVISCQNTSWMLKKKKLYKRVGCLYVAMIEADW